MCSKCSECCQGSRHSVDASPTPGSDSDASEEEWNPDGKGRQSNDTGLNNPQVNRQTLADRNVSSPARGGKREIVREWEERERVH
ncbi:hypothetical protein ALC62_08440 [Cyphomyrmex costatus]|uniref:Uncharacterized protein n=1 Tax=Cyphomyrmex costatus TaxID=456900 RepID=A0A195CJY4_9HYME|nr:hypothetical protein ALC62_08440 [Cyphomyrmex costatus]